MEESDSLIDTWRGRVEKYLDGLSTEVDRMSSQALKKNIRADKVAPRTWAAIIKKVCIAPKKDNMGECIPFPNDSWHLVGKSLTRITAASFGFVPE